MGKIWQGRFLEHYNVELQTSQLRNLTLTSSRGGGVVWGIWDLLWCQMERHLLTWRAYINAQNLHYGPNVSLYWSGVSSVLKYITHLEVNITFLPPQYTEKYLATDLGFMKGDCVSATRRSGRGTTTRKVSDQREVKPWRNADTVTTVVKKSRVIRWYDF